MNFGNVVKGGFIALGLCFASALFAEQTTELDCPTAKDIQSYQSLMAFPYGYDNQSNKVKYINLSVAKQSTTTLSPWFMVTYPILVTPNEEVHATANSLFKTLTPVSLKPIQSNIVDMAVITGEDDDYEDKNLENVTFCIYKTAGQNNVSAIAYYHADGEDMNDSDMAKKVMKLASKFAK